MNRNNIESIYILTPMQEGLLYHSLQDSKQYLDQYCCKLSGNVNANNLIKAWEAVFSENAILRTAFVWENVRDFLQVILKNSRVDFPLYDWSSISEEEIQHKLQLFLSRELEKGFELDKAPLTRLALIKISENEYYFVWTIHHLIVDGMSLPQLLGQVYENYKRLCNNEQTLPHKTLPFKAYVDWIKRQERSQAVNYWREYLEGFYEPTQLVKQNPSLSVKEAEQKSCLMPIEQSLVNKLQNMAKKYGLSVFQLYNLAYAIMLSRISGRKDVIYGMIVSGRPLDLQGANETIGIFINTVPMRMKFKEDLELLSCLRITSSDQVKRNRFEYLPLTDIIALSEPGKELFQSLFIFENYSIEDIYMDKSIGFEISDEKTRVATNYPLTWIVLPETTTKLNILYNTAFIDEPTIKEYVKHYIGILKQLALNLEIPFSEFKIGEKEERTVNDGAAGVKPYETLKNSFGKSAKSLALQLDDRQWTYEALEHRANPVLKQMRKMGIKDSAGGQKKAAIVSRNITVTAICVLSAIKSGIQPVMLGKGLENKNDIYSKAGFILTDTDSVKAVPSKFWAKCIFVDVNNARQETKEPWENVEDYFLLIHSAAGEDIISGSSLAEDYEELAGQSVTIDSDAYDHNFIVILLLNMLMKGSSVKVIKYIRGTEAHCVFTSCEKLLSSENSINQINSKVYLNLYDGLMNYKEMSEKKLWGKGIEINLFLSDIYIGREIYCVCLNNSAVRKNCAVVVDKNNNSLGKEFMGKICFPITKGYQSSRSLGLKATGYRGRLRADGTLELWLNESRIGNIGGTYVDYEAAEKKLKESGLAEDVIFVGRRTTEGKQKTMVYYESKEKQIEALSAMMDLISLLWEIRSDKLKNYIDFCSMEKLPYDWEGCVSISKLQERERISSSVSEYSMPQIKEKPQSHMEKTVSAIWESVLNKSHIGNNHNFFDLGGNSIAIMKVISRTASALKLPVTIEDLFTNPTVGEFSALLEKYKKDSENNFVVEKPQLSEEHKLSGVLASFAQQRFWFLHQYENNADVFNNVSEVVKLTGTVNEAALSRTIEYLSSRQEALRTVFFMKEGAVYQKVLKSVTDTFSITDLSQENTELKEKLVSELLEKELRRQFDFENGPLFYCNLMKIDDGEYIFVFVIHHIIADGWSVGIFINELMEAYQKYCLELIPSLPKIEWQYSEYSIWQKNKLTNGIMDKQLVYWKNKLNDAAELNFPLDFERPAIQSFSGRKMTSKYPRKLMDKVNNVAKNAGTTPFAVYLAALNVLLSRYSGQEDIVVGSPVTKRPLKEVENTIGCFLNTLVYRNDLSGNPTFIELIKRVSQTSVEAFKNQDIPFEVLVDKTGATRDLSKNPLFQILFLFQNEPHPDKEIAGLKVERLESENKASMLDLSISMEEAADGVSVLYEYNTDLFRAETIERLSTHFERILGILCSDTRLRINDFHYMPEEEMKRILYGFNATKTAFDTKLFIHQLFEEQAEKHPQWEAVRFRDQSLTYKELNIRMNKLANYLLNLGTRKGQMIAVYMERSIEMVVALYGILKAGAAYVPIDPDYPEERIKYMLLDSGVEVVLTQHHKAEALKEGSIKTIVLGEQDVTSAAGVENPRVPIEDEDYAYMIYTSGSTGRPKGVINTHKGIRNRILWIRSAFPIEEKWRQMQKTPFSFDVSCGEFFGSLTIGGCLVVAEPGGHKDVDYLIDLINKEKITHIHFVPSLLKAFLYNPRISEVKGLKQVACTGEPLPYSLVERFKKLFEDCDLFNLYGPTEAAVEVSYWNCRKRLHRNIIPIGTPIVNTQLYILDRNLRPVPIGVCGELYISGDNLAAGYHNRKELNAERFIKNPFSDVSNPIMYRTGDFARYLPGGEIDFIGRIDNQVKVRGNRIELSEIEVNINSYARISEAHVIVSKEETPRIIAYIALEDKSLDVTQRNELISELRQHLRKKLPEYMIPSFIMALEEMPLLPNGKLNLKELPLPAVSRDYITNSYTEASGDIELKLKQIWSEVLNLKEIGVNDNFFEMGGHSLLLMEVYNKLKESMDTKLTVVDMFKYPTIRSLSKYIYDMKNHVGIKGEMEEESKSIIAGTRDRRRNSARMKELHQTV